MSCALHVSSVLLVSLLPLDFSLFPVVLVGYELLRNGHLSLFDKWGRFS